MKTITIKKNSKMKTIKLNKNGKARQPRKTNVDVKVDSILEEFFGKVSRLNRVAKMAKAELYVKVTIPSDIDPIRNVGDIIVGSESGPYWYKSYPIKDYDHEECESALSNVINILNNEIDCIYKNIKYNVKAAIDPNEIFPIPLS